MKITKYEHACLMLDDGKDRLVIDPGKFTQLPDDLTRIRTVVVAEEHFDHFDVDNLKKILAQSPQAQIFTTKAVADELTKAGIEATGVSGAQTVDADGFNVTLTEGDHAIVYGSSPCRVVTVRVGDWLYYPADSLITTAASVKVLAAPVSGPWYKLSEMIDFVNAIKSQEIISTHDGLNSETGNQMIPQMVTGYLKDKSRKWTVLKVRESKDF